ncbi:MAG: hypothetical protein Ta2E_02000 [Mycoplasmoidaceae bacterium]|nr:MAG: hypothetical protein Ta2E_02000 [Mycoplasmoidaceae bacterium]
MQQLIRWINELGIIKWQQQRIMIEKMFHACSQIAWLRSQRDVIMSYIHIFEARMNCN